MRVAPVYAPVLVRDHPRAQIGQLMRGKRVALEAKLENGTGREIMKLLPGRRRRNVSAAHAGAFRLFSTQIEPAVRDECALNQASQASFERRVARCDQICTSENNYSDSFGRSLLGKSCGE